MDNCKTCDHRVFNEQWGAYECEIYGHRVKDAYKYNGCESYDRKEGKKKNDSDRS